MRFSRVSRAQADSILRVLRVIQPIIFVVMLAFARLTFALPCPVCEEDHEPAEMIECQGVDGQRHFACLKCTVRGVETCFSASGRIECLTAGCEHSFNLNHIEERMKRLVLSSENSLSDGVNPVFWEISRSGDHVTVGKMGVLRAASFRRQAETRVRQDTNQTYCPGCFTVTPKTQSRRRWCNQSGCSFGAGSLGYCQSCQTRFHFHGDCPIEPTERLWENLSLGGPLVGVAGQQSETWLKQHTKACPKCGLLFEKNGGCGTITCGGNGDARPLLGIGCGQKFSFLSAFAVTDALVARIRTAPLIREDDLDLREPRSHEVEDGFVHSFGANQDEQIRVPLLSGDSGSSGVHCGGCREAIAAVRFECLHCEDFSLCRFCAQKHVLDLRRVEANLRGEGGIGWFAAPNQTNTLVHSKEHSFRIQFSSRQLDHFAAELAARQPSPIVQVEMNRDEAERERLLVVRAHQFNREMYYCCIGTGSVCVLMAVADPGPQLVCIGCAGALLQIGFVPFLFSDLAEWRNGQVQCLVREVCSQVWRSRCSCSTQFPSASAAERRHLFAERGLLIQGLVGRLPAGFCRSAATAVCCIPMPID